MKFLLIFVLPIVSSLILGFTIVPQFQGIEIFTTCLTVLSICLALFCFIIPKWEVWRDQLLDYDECLRKATLDNIESYNKNLNNFEQIKEIDPKLVQTSQERIKTLIKHEMVKLNKFSQLHKEAEGPILGYKQLITLCIWLLAIHFVLNVILIPSEEFVNCVKTNFTIIDIDILIWFVKRLSSSVKILNIAVQLFFLYKIAKDTVEFTLCLRSKEYIEKLDINDGKSEPSTQSKSTEIKPE